MLGRTPKLPSDLLVLVVLLAIGCASVETTSAPSPARTGATASTSAAPPARATDGVEGQVVHVLGLWSGPELDSFEAIKAAWEQETGGAVKWQGTQNVAETLEVGSETGDAPEIAILPNPGLMHRLASDGTLVPLDAVLDMGQVMKDYARAWIDLGSDHGTLYGILVKASSKSTVWYSPKAFVAAGYGVPTTWDDMLVLADTMVADDRTPFSVVAPASPAAGWALTDWISQLVLSACGPDHYDEWVAGSIPWTDACIKQAFERFVRIVDTPGYVLGGAQGILGTTDADGSYPMYSDPPAAYMYYLASFAQAFIASRYPDLRPGDGYDAFSFPSIEPANAGAVMVGADVVVMLKDTPAARSFMTYLAGASAQEAWVDLGGFTSVNRSVSLDRYPDAVARHVAQELTRATVSRFGAGDLMPAAVQRAWWGAMLELVQDPKSLDSTLKMLTDVAKSAAR